MLRFLKHAALKFEARFLVFVLINMTGGLLGFEVLRLLLQNRKDLRAAVGLGARTPAEPKGKALCSDGDERILGSENDECRHFPYSLLPRSSSSASAFSCAERGFVASFTRRFLRRRLM